MTILNDYFTYKISTSYMTAIINNDYSGLSDEEEKQIEDFLSTAGLVGFSNLRDATFEITEEDPHYALCEICDLYAECYVVRLYFTNPSLAAYDFPVLVHNHETGARFYIHNLTDFIEYLNETDEFNTYTSQERTA